MTFIIANSVCAILTVIAAVRFYRRNFFFHALSGMYLVLFILVPIVHFSFFDYEIQMRGAVFGPIISERYFLLYVQTNLMISAGLFFASYSRFFLLPECIFGESELRVARTWSLLMALIGLGLFIYVIDAYASLRAGNFLAVLTRGRMDHFDSGQAGTVRAISYYCASFLPVLAFTSTLVPRNRVKYLLVVFLIACAMLLLTGGRKWVILAASGVFAARFYMSKVGARDYMVGIAAVFFLIMWQFVRSTRFQSGDWTTIDLARPFFEGDIVYFYYASLESIRQYYENNLFYPFASIRALLFLPFPSEWTFDLKIKDLAHVTNFFVSPVTFREVNNPPGLIGLSYINLGPAGVLVLAVMAIVVQWCLRLRMVGLFKMCLLSSLLYLEIRLLRGSIGGIYIVLFQVAVFAAIWSAAGVTRAIRNVVQEERRA